MAEVLLSAGFRWPVCGLIANLMSREIFALHFITHFAGFSELELFDRFDHWWLSTTSMFIAIPWLPGLLAGTVLSHARMDDLREPAP